MDKLATQDSRRIRACLQDRPMTAAEISAQLRLSIPRINRLLQSLQQEGIVHTHRCTTGPKGNTVNLWELHPAHQSATADNQTTP